MPPIEVGPARAIGAINARLARKAGGETLSGANGVSTEKQAAPAVEKSPALDPGPAPVDTDRVQVIRKAVESGTYPVIPTQIADAMIAAGVLLRSGKQ
ncbi:flagellar biosynthesis anti-sigma factor FlgM [Novosphingobium album (ex Liu et al. 2023)]|uniref:Flagellar biosynthesis anti-sigma factor FlgM n=1 Tax=Novosphingobium album (ex Liu et al. 2023) TaxID=3031130 RepID=A0ABT5WM83_9SPHN|nr:flagellar biosynthesis anti-sigma factor FlgM [Novosphingobium album (ex Liu et al. 2023)]MDE8651157.1 flagellar biosynthesis anti-sigma factor FlgM [Novosphingobium album (ex Liu et al. 2023)]